MKSDISGARKEIEQGSINESNKKQMLGLDARLYTEGKAESSRHMYMRAWYRFALYLGNKKFMDITQEDIDNFFYEFCSGSFSKNNKPPSMASKKFCIISIKKLYGMVCQGKWENKCPEPIKKLKVPKKDDGGLRSLKKEDLLTHKEIERMVHAADDIKWKALIKVLFETGFRVSELLSMTIKSVNFEEKSTEAFVSINSSKTKKRTVLVIWSLPELRHWINEHPLNNNENAPLWLSRRSNAMCKRNVEYIIKQSAERAGIRKRVYPHLLRHSMVTWRMRMGMVRKELCMYGGWSEKSNMPEHYSHFDIEDMFNRQRRQAGLSVSDEDDEIPIKQYEDCPLCKKHYPIGYAVCDDCHIPLDHVKWVELLKEAQKRNDLIENMKKAEPMIQKLMPLMEKINATGNFEKALEVLKNQS